MNIVVCKIISKIIFVNISHHNNNILHNKHKNEMTFTTKRIKHFKCRILEHF